MMGDEKMSDGSPDPEKHFKIKNSLLRYFGTLGKVSQQDALEDDILTMVNEGQENGVIQDGEAKMISNIFALNDKDAGDIMTHRSQITGIDSSMPLQDALNFMLDANNSRFPVYNKNMDHIIGILHLKDVCRINRIPGNREKSVNDIPGLLREVLYTA